MSILNYSAKYILFFLYGLIILGLLSSCSRGKFWDPADARKVPPNVNERVRKNLEEGKGFSIGKSMSEGRGGTSYQFASSNPMWRATLETVSYTHLTLPTKA